MKEVEFWWITCSVNNREVFKCDIFFKLFKFAMSLGLILYNWAWKYQLGFILWIMLIFGEICVALNFENLFWFAMNFDNQG